MIAGDLKHLLERVPDDAVIVIPSEEGFFKRASVQSIGFADPNGESDEGIYAELYAIEEQPLDSLPELEGEQYYLLAIGYEWPGDGVKQSYITS